MSSNYPDDIRQHDNDPHSPFYDDGGAEAWTETRYMELIESETLEDLPGLDADKLLEIVEQYYNAPNCENRSIMVAKIVEHVEEVADKQSDEDFEDMKNGNPEPDNDGPEPSDFM